MPEVLLAIPSIRDIHEVQVWWHQIKHDKYIVKGKNHRKAYLDIKDYFTKHTEYDTLIISSDDLEITPTAVKMLLDDIDNNSFLTVSGYCNIDETQPDTYAVQPLGSQDFTRKGPDTTFGSWYMKAQKPIFPTDKRFLEVGFEGFCCQVITRELFDMIDLTGPGEIKGNFDWNFCRQCHDLKVPIMVDTEVKMYHRRFQQSNRVQEFVQNPAAQEHGYSYTLEG